MKFSNYLICGLVVSSFLSSSCGPSKKVHEDRLYLRNIESAMPMDVKPSDIVIEVGDMLAIQVFSDNPEATLIFNQGAVGANEKSGSNSTGATGGGYQVNANGDIRFYALGNLHVQGLNKTQLASLLEQKLSVYLKNPYVEIRFTNGRVTVLGEVSRPGILNIPEQKVSLLDALALSGDLTGYGRRDNILVIREQNGKRTIGRLDIRNPNIYKSEYFYLQHNDMVYVEPIRKKPSFNEQSTYRNVSLATSIASIIIVVISLFKK
jgi:polysaccharide biosynthesis/export protein